MKLNKKNLLNEKGQAALLDSVIFLTIVASISAGLLFFTVNYGTQTQSQLTSFYSSDFSADALKIVTYINVARDGSKISKEYIETSNLFNEPVELDYLLALIKEDYSDKKVISKRTQVAIKNTFESALRPFENSIDYVYYLYSEDTSRYLFLLFAVHKCTEGCEPNVVQTAIGEVSENATTPKVVERIFYFCEPVGSTQYLERELFPTLGKIDSAFGKITLPESTGESSTLDSIGRPFVMALQVWIVRDSSKLNQIGDTGHELNCIEIESNN